jgi:hypothetical protein
MFAPRCLLALAGLYLLSSATSTRAAEPEKWNIVSIVTDDQGAWALACYGNKDCRTPNMDRLAREGVRPCALYSTVALYTTGNRAQSC